MTDCPNCEYHRQRAQLWRDEAYKLSGHPLPDREQEPVAWLCRRKVGGSLFVYTEEQLYELGYGNISVPPFDKVSPLYTTPPQRTWVGLTNEERADCWETIPELAMKKVEAKLKEKNG